ncbi:hypothetical protein N7532_004282 [Penicillium argentinense]|uniref:Arb2 domain-containing protein n=1 Tax=Penicillium argentinense TaxID=1131581 RepID=A0A9W9KFH7_9EURO|nr:uncharacterized protein N7532_004282 [Penicillium argentinense]KAJ5103753.1 hypothetical protein N7532_004282 [Penicillium argentinense]
MFVYRNKDLPEDPYFPADLAKLGYCITENDQLRSIKDHTAEFMYRINRNERYNIKNREATNDCIRAIISQRLQDAGLEYMRLPLHTVNDRIIESENNVAHVPIMVSPNLNTADRIFVVFGEPMQDLGVWAYRVIGHDTINKGSAVEFVNGVLGEENKTGNALVLANTGQLLWNWATSRAVTTATWDSLPRPSGNWGAAATSWRNKIPFNKDWREHIMHVFNNLLWPLVRGKQTRIDIIGISEGGLGAIQFLDTNWQVWRPFISGICLGNPLQEVNADIDMSTVTDPSSFPAFVSSRCRAYVLSDEKVGTRHSGYRQYGCNCYSAGEACHTECILPSAWRDMLKWLDVLYKDPSYAEKVVIIGDDLEKETLEAMQDLKVTNDEEEGEAKVFPELAQEDVQNTKGPDGSEDAKKDAKEAAEMDAIDMGQQEGNSGEAQTNGAETEKTA